MQLPLPLTAPGAAEPAARIPLAGRSFDVVLARHPRARRYVLRMTRDGRLRLTVPRCASVSGGLAFARRQEAWIAREWHRRSVANAPWTTGTRIRFRGDLVTLEVAGDRIVCGAERIAVPPGAPGEVRVLVERHLRALADAELPDRCRALAASCGHALRRVTIRDQRSRWGACSAKGAVSLNWRLVQMPPAVSDYICLHEIMHLRQPNHSRRFWREVESVCAGWRDAERWLRRHGREIL